MSEIRIVVAESQPVYLKGLSDFLAHESDITAVGTTTNGADALALIRKHRPDIAILDVVMKRHTGLEVLQTLRADHFSSRVIFLTDHEVKETAFTALASGAWGYLLKIRPWDEIAEAIRAVAAGERRIDPQIQGPLAEHMANQAQQSATNLGVREIQVLRLLKRGMTYKTIGEELGISDNTVRSHSKNIMRKFGVGSRVEAVSEGMRYGFIDGD